MNAVCAEKKAWGGSVLYALVESLCVCHCYFQGLEATAPHILSLARFQGVLFKCVTGM